jgi:hypothetical protein
MPDRKVLTKYEYEVLDLADHEKRLVKQRPERLGLGENYV